MAHMICSATFLLLIVALSKSASYHDYFRLIRDVQKYYKTNCIVFVYSSNYTDFKTMTVLHVWTKESSREGVLSMSMAFSEISFYIQQNRKRINRPLFVALLTTKESVYEFSRITTQIYVSFPKWFVMFVELIDFPKDPPLKDLCLNPTWNTFHVMFNTEMLILCYDDPVLKEWYAINDNQTRTYNLATWKPGEAMEYNTNRSLYARRNDMFGELLRISIVKVSPLIELKDGKLTDFLGDVITEMSKSMNFTINLIEVTESYGSWNKEKKIWSGAIGKLLANTTDFGVSEFTMTPMRMEVIEYTSPLVFSHYGLFCRKPDGSNIDWSGYLKVFDLRIWASLLFIILSVPFLLTLIKTKGCLVKSIVMDNFINILGIYCQQGLSEFPTETPLRLAFLSLLLSALIVSSSYSASLITFLTVSQDNLPFTNIVEFAKDRSYKLIVYKNGAEFEMFLNAMDSFSLKLKKKMKEREEMPSNAEEAFTQVCNEKVGFYTTAEIRDSIDFKLPCEVIFIDGGRVNNLGLTLPKDNQFKGVVNFNLQRYKDAGILNRYKTMYLTILDPPETGYTMVTVWGVAPILVLLAGGIILGSFLLIIEKTYHYYIVRCKSKKGLQKMFKPLVNNFKVEK